MPSFSRFCLLVLFVIIFSPILLAQIPNSGFELWTGGSPNNPVGWYANNVLGVAIPVTQTSTVHGGTSALRGDVVTLGTAPYAPSVGSGQGLEGFPVTQRYATLTGFYRFSPVGGDRFGVDVVMYNYGVEIGVGAIALTPTVSSYTEFTVNIVYQQPSVPDTCLILIIILGPTGSDYHVGSIMYVDDLSLSGVVAVDERQTKLPETFALHQNYPNPFNPSTTILYDVPQRGRVLISIYTLLGENVAVLVDEEKEVGRYSVTWDGTNGKAEHVGSGTYFCRMIAGNTVQTRKLLLLK